MNSTTLAWQMDMAPALRSARGRDEGYAASFEADDLSAAPLEQTPPGLTTQSALWRGAARREGSVGLFHCLEASLEWLIPAAALIWAMHGLLSL